MPETVGMETAGSPAAGPIGTPLPPGTPVEVRRRFDQRWARGFAVDAVDGGRYLLRRRSDNRVLPDAFDGQEVRPEGSRG